MGGAFDKKRVVRDPGHFGVPPRHKILPSIGPSPIRAHILLSIPTSPQLSSPKNISNFPPNVPPLLRLPSQALRSAPVPTSVEPREAEFFVTNTGAPEPTPTGELMVLQQQALRDLFRDPTPLTRESFIREMTIVARAAVAEGQFAPAAKLYELAGKNLGAIDTPAPTLHQHVHLTTAAKDSEFARASDEELRRIIQEAQDVSPSRT